MRTFAEKPKTPQQTTPTKSTIARRAHMGHDNGVNSLLHLQRTIGNQAVLRMLSANTEAESLSNNATGKSGAPPSEEGQWLPMSGNGGPGPTPSLPTAPTYGVTPVPATPPKLKKKTISGPSASDCGGFSWVIQWELDKKTTVGGWVVQKVEVPYNVKGCDGKAFDSSKGNGLQTGWYPLWEAWQINKNQKVTTYAEKADVEDDTYSSPSPAAGTKGSVTVKGTAEFYEGLTLPASFKVTNKPPTGILPATKSAPTLSGGTGSISHNLKASWDCCSKGKAATKKTKVEVV